MSLQRTPKPQKITPLKKDEKILVVAREKIIPTPGWHGIKSTNFDPCLQIINQEKQFLWRSQMEQDPTYKQIIPYLIFTHQNKYFLMQRKGTASEQRLKNKYSLGIGGHIRQEDMTSESISDWAKREFHEEVNYAGKLEIEPVGILNDDSNAVGRVHLGLVLLLKGDSEAISVRSELKNGKLASLKECELLEDSLESWSQEVFKTLKTKMSF